MKTIIAKTTEIILTSVEELKNLPDGEVVQSGHYYEWRGFDYDPESDLCYIKEADGLHCDDDEWYDMTWEKVAVSILMGQVYRLSQDVEVISVDGE